MAWTCLWPYSTIRLFTISMSFSEMSVANTFPFFPTLSAIGNVMVPTAHPYSSTFFPFTSPKILMISLRMLFEREKPSVMRLRYANRLCVFRTALGLKYNSRR